MEAIEKDDASEGYRGEEEKSEEEGGREINKELVHFFCCLKREYMWKAWQSLGMSF